MHRAHATFRLPDGSRRSLGAGDLVGFGDFPEVRRVLQAFVERPAVARGLLIPAAPPAP